jgi:hypothetical protein
MLVHHTGWQSYGIVARNNTSLREKLFL